MAGGGGGLAVRVWKELGIQILVVTSFLLILLLFGGLRRRSSSIVLLAFLWLLYLMADNIAVYALGHMTLESRLQDDAGLVAFWATFFLLHLGGQDTITAFSLEDNQLWRRHLLTLVVQASGTSYAIYRYTLSGTWTLVSATIVMFIVGLLKYGERVWALQRGNSSDTFSLTQYPGNTQSLADMLKSRAKMDREEVILLESHYMFHFCKGAFFNVQRIHRFYTLLDSHFTEKEPPTYASDFRNKQRLPLPYECDKRIYDLVEAELSLLYDLFYTKAQVAHTWQGYLIRAISLLGMVSAFVLFRLDNSTKGAYIRVDVFITYLLLVGAIILEIASIFTIVGSTWTCDYLHRNGWNRTNAMVMRLRWLFKVGSQRKWLHSIGQHNVLDYYCRDQAKWTYMICKSVGLQKWWRGVAFSRNTPVTPKFKELVFERILTTMTAHSKTWSILDAQGKALLTKYGIFDDFLEYSEERSFADYVVNWQVATDIYLHFCNDQQHQSKHLNTQDDPKPLVEEIKVLSNYMGFLMLHPKLLPGGVPRSDTTGKLYKVPTCNISSKDYAWALLHGKVNDPILSVSLANKLFQKRNDLPVLQVIFEVWVELLCYAAHHSTDISHCRQLGRGGEFLSVIRLVVDHIELFQKYNERPSTDEASHP